MIQNFIGGMGGLGKGIFGARRGKPFLRTLKYSDFTAASVTVSTTTFTKIGSYTVPAQQKINFGYGSPKEPHNQSFIYVKLIDAAAADVDGMLRLFASDANEYFTDVIFEERTDLLDGDLVDKTKKVPFPEITDYPHMGRSPQQDDKLHVALKGDSADTIYTDTSIIYCPVSVYSM